MFLARSPLKLQGLAGLWRNSRKGSSGLVAEYPFKGGDEIIVCGGDVYLTDWRDCHTFSLSDNQWKKASFQLNVGRTNAASVLLDNGTMMIFGGQNKNFDSLNSIEILPNATRSFKFGPNMPSVPQKCFWQVVEGAIYIFQVPTSLT